jgi:hypothetical protein
MGQLGIGLAFIAAGIALNLLFPPTLPDQDGFKLDDLSVTGSAYGKPINLAYGTVRLNGNLFWAIDKIEVVNTETVGENFLGKGGSDITTRTYFGTFAIGFAEGPADAILKIWANNKLIWDSTAPIGSGTAVDNGKYPITFYQGTKTQLPDPDIELDKGVGNTPAYRDITYFVAKEWPLKDFGNAIPNITAEITFNGTSVTPVDFFDINQVNIYPGGAFVDNTDEWITINPFTGQAMTFAKNFMGYLDRNTDKSVLEVTIADGFTVTQGLKNSIHLPVYDDFVYSWWGNTSDLVGPIDATTRRKISIRSGSTLHTWNDGASTFTDTRGPPCHLRIGSAELGVGELDFAVFLLATGGSGASRDPTKCFFDGVDLGQGMLEVPLEEIGLPFSDTTSTEAPCMSDWFSKRHFYLCQTSTSYRLYEVRGEIVIDEVGSIKGNPILEQRGSDIVKATLWPAGGATMTGFCFLPNEEAIILSNGTSMAKVTYEDFSLVATRSDLGFEAVHNWTLNNRFAFADGDHDETGTSAGFYIIDTDDLSTIEFVPKVAPLVVGDTLVGETAYDSRTHSLILSQGLGSDIPTDDFVGAELFLQRDSGGGVLLSDIVTDISNKAGIDSSDIDVTDLTTTTVDGYVISRESTYRQMLEPLQRVYFFEGHESDWITKFVSRGKAVVGSIAESDVGKLKPNDFKLIETRINDIELPGEVLMSYVDVDRDKEKNTSSARRTSKPAKTQFSDTDLEFEVSIVMDSTLADQVTERSLYTLWAERIQLASELPWKYLKFDPTDNLTMVFNNESRRVRMSTFNIGADLSIQFEATQEDSDSHVSTVTGFGGDGFLIQTLPSLGTVIFLPLDSPLQLDADASLLQFSRSYYAFGELNGSAVLYRSLDSGQSYDPVDGQSIEATWGFVSGLMPNPVTTFTWDESSTITITPIDQAQRLVSSTDLAVLNGANALAIKHSDGGVEIVQYVNVTDNGDGTFTLSRLLRGRRGTEDLALAGNTTVSPLFVYLNEGVRTFQTQISNINTGLPYRAVATGQFLTDTAVNNETYTGQDLIPYSVADIESSISAGNKVVDWKRRTRHSGELFDLTGTVPLNEESEKYDVEYFTPSDTAGITPILTRTDLTSPTDTLTKTEWETNFNNSLGATQLYFLNWDFEENTLGAHPDGWVIHGTAGTNADVVTSAGSLSGPPTGGNASFLHFDTGVGTIAAPGVRATVDLVAAGFTVEQLDSFLTLSYDMWMGMPAAVGDSVNFRIEFLDDALAFISAIETGLTAVTNGTWQNFTGNGTIPIGCRNIYVQCEADNGGAGDARGAFDKIVLTLGNDEVRKVNTKIYQKSSIMGRGRSTLVGI